MNILMKGKLNQLSQLFGTQRATRRSKLGAAVLEFQQSAVDTTTCNGVSEHMTQELIIAPCTMEIQVFQENNSARERLKDLSDLSSRSGHCISN